MPRVILLPPLTASGHIQMGLDGWLLAAGPADVCAVRLYAWDPPCLSLGHFQRLDGGIDAALPPHDTLTRATGGGAIFHDDEITWSVSGPREHPALIGPMAEVYARLNRSWIAAVREATGIVLSERDDAVRPRPRSQKPFACFDDSAGSDLVAGSGVNRKILGSAGRETAGRRLVHGSLLVGRNPLSPSAPCLRDFAPGLSRDTLLGPLGAAFAAALARECGGVPERAGWPPGAPAGPGPVAMV